MNTVVNALDQLAALAETASASGDTWPVSAWKISGVITGDGSTDGFRFVGGTPTPSLVAQDTAASAWAVSVSISGQSLVVTVTGASGKTIRWNAVAKLVEVAT